MQTQLITHPESDASTLITPLAYVEAYDAVLNDDYAMVAYKETDRGSNTWRVRIKSRHTTGVVFEPDAMRLPARSATAQGKPFFNWGNGIDPSPSDQRSIQYRVHVKDAKPSHIEIFLQMRKADGSPDAPQSVTFPWPA